MSVHDELYQQEDGGLSLHVLPLKPTLAGDPDTP